MKRLWMRMGVSIDLSDAEVNTLLAGKDQKESECIIKGAIREGRAFVDGESYVPEPVVEALCEQQGLPIPSVALEWDFAELSGINRGLDREPLSVDTPAGPLYIRPLTDPEYPGVDIYMLDADGHEINIAAIEHIPGGEACEGDDRIAGDVIPKERTFVKSLPDSQKNYLALTPGLMARVWNDRDRDDPISIAFINL